MIGRGQSVLQIGDRRAKRPRLAGMSIGGIGGLQAALKIVEHLRTGDLRLGPREVVGVRRASGRPATGRGGLVGCSWIPGLQVRSGDSAAPGLPALLGPERAARTVAAACSSSSGLGVELAGSHLQALRARSGVHHRRDFAAGGGDYPGRGTPGGCGTAGTTGVGHCRAPAAVVAASTPPRLAAPAPS